MPLLQLGRAGRAAHDWFLIMGLNIIHAEDGQRRHRSRRWILQQDLGVFSFPVPNMEISLTRLIVIPVPPILGRRASGWR